MLVPRVIPCLLLRGSGLVKTIRFGDEVYLGDPINIARIFNDKEVDELVVLDIGAARDGRRPQVDRIARLAAECFMPLCYGGGIRSLDDMRELFGVGVEKVSVNTAAVENPGLVRAAVEEFGSQSIVVSIDALRRSAGACLVATRGGTRRTGHEVQAYARQMEAEGAGEILLTSIDRDGTREGYDLDLVKSVTGAVTIPVVACGGAGTIDDLAAVVVDGGASGAGAGSLFVFQGRHRAVLISYPSKDDLAAAFSRRENAG
jgi:imidazole glycerol-phosphate synthase subunit HisF